MTAAPVVAGQFVTTAEELRGLHDEVQELRTRLDVQLRELADLREWLEAVAGDMLDRTA